MANYVCATRTNYFRVKDEEEFRKLMSRVHGEDAVDLWEKTVNDEKLFAFGCYGLINGLRNDAMEAASQQVRRMLDNPNYVLECCY